jgi:hypothetical protein
MAPWLVTGMTMQAIETLEQALVHAESAALRAYEAACGARRKIRADDRRGEPGDAIDALVDATHSAWMVAFERRWALG